VSKKKRGIPVQKETVEKEKAATDNTGAAAASRDVDEVYIHCVPVEARPKFNFLQVCDQLPASADNVTLLAVVLQQSINICCSLGPQQQTHRNGVRQPNNETDGRRTDGHPTVTYILLRVLCEQCQ